jgi:hypothetical protein
MLEAATEIASHQGLWCDHTALLPWLGRHNWEIAKGPLEVGYWSTSAVVEFNPPVIMLGRETIRKSRGKEGSGRLVGAGNGK